MTRMNKMTTNTINTVNIQCYFPSMRVCSYYYGQEMNEKNKTKLLIRQTPFFINIDPDKQMSRNMIFPTMWYVRYTFEYYVKFSFWISV